MGEQRILGYARVSSTGQNLDRQIMELKKYVPEENIVVDKASGKNLDRPGYQALKGALGLRKGDVLVIKSLDRLSRNKREIKQELEWFREKGIILKIIDLPTTMIQLPEGLSQYSRRRTQDNPSKAEGGDCCCKGERGNIWKTTERLP